jgi:hypothetical protein
MKNSSAIGVHQGQALRHFADRYPTIIEVILELVQNALDVSANNIWVTIDLKGQRRRVTVRDNGNGATEQMFENALATIGRSIKEAGKLGRYGLGLVSPFGKCQVHTFTTCHRSKPSAFNRWIFKNTMLDERHVAIPREQVDGLTYRPNGKGGKTGVPWRTEMRLDNVTSDRIQGAIDLDELKRLIVQKYGIVMREQGTIVHVSYIDTKGVEHNSDITATQRLGKPLPVVKYKGQGGAETTFRLFLAERTSAGRKGEVLFGEDDNPYRLTPKQFLISVATLLDNDVAAALRSGIFEGEITCNKVSLSSSRRSFEQNDALLELLSAICVWYEEHGKEHIDAAEAEQEGQRYRELAMRSLPVISDMVERAGLGHLLAQIRQGNIGKNHNRENQRPVANSEFSGHAAKKSGDNDDTPSTSSGNTRETNPNPKEHTNHTPWVVEGGTSKRIRVRGGSTGLIFVYADMRNSNKLCELDLTTGELTFNVRHPDWAAADVGPTSLMRFQELIALREISLLGQPEHYRPVQQMPSSAFNSLVAHYAANADRIRGTKRGRVKKSNREQ